MRNARKRSESSKAIARKAAKGRLLTKADFDRLFQRADDEPWDTETVDYNQQNQIRHPNGGAER